MEIIVSDNAKTLGKTAGTKAEEILIRTIREKGSANLIVATGTSQFETLNHLISGQQIEWEKVTMFHLDEYIGLSETHPASFRKYLKERFISKVSIKKYYLVDGEADPVLECERLSALIRHHPIDLALVGIGENGHLAFNDPPADFATDKPYIVVELDDMCRRQQMGEGWFASIDEVPRQAISMSIRQIMKSKEIICSVPDKRKATAVKNTIEEKVGNMFPASILRDHPYCYLYLDSASASELTREAFKSNA
jgi:glucosamine-6-phosphate deaminase